ncbi:MAG: DUF389 domain-containing protein [Bacteroidales bacterium]|nr:DUF389 domain-containing protein [Bacteroidales bacterium]
MADNITFWTEIKKYFSMKGFLTDKNDVTRRINDGIIFRGPNLWVLVFAILIASLGLNMNSTAVIIGAMLISPLMGPIIGMGFGVGTDDFDLLKKSFKNYAVATIISLLTASLYFLLTPYKGAQSELLARTSPTLYDVLIALCGGAAGIVALGAKDRGNIIPGVAIATALMPPLCTAGFGIASLNLKFFLGAFYLYFINSVFIALATFIGVRAMKFSKKDVLEDRAYKRVRFYITVIVVATMVPAAIMTVSIIRDSILHTGVDYFIRNELKYPGTQIITHNADRENKVLTLAAVGRELSENQINDATTRLPKYGLEGYRLNLIQGSISDSLISLKGTISNMVNSKEELNATITHLNLEISDLKDQLSHFTRYEFLTKQIVKELQSFYPAIELFSLSESVESGKDTNSINKFLSAIITLNPDSKSGLSKDDILKISDYVKSRVAADSVVVIVR